jgi:nitronate monooxygenase
MRAPAFSTRLTKLLGIKHPVLCGGLIHLADGKYVAAVVNAGGMGFITALSSPNEIAFREQLKICRDLTEGKPFGVCISVSRRPEANQRIPGLIDVFLEEGVRIVETSGHSPDVVMPKLKVAGCTVVHKAPSLRYALSAERLGADAVTIVGVDAAGHPGMDGISSFSIAPLAAKRLTIPFVIAGGIGSGRQLLAALAMGADGVLLGTRMLCAAEIWAHPRYKEHLLTLGERDTRLLLGLFQNNHRVLANETAHKVGTMEAERITDIAQYLPLLKGEITRSAYESGQLTDGMIDLGPAIAYVERVQTVEEIFDQLIDEAEAGAGRLSALSFEALNRRTNAAAG